MALPPAEPSANSSETTLEAAALARDAVALATRLRALLDDDARAVSALLTQAVAVLQMPGDSPGVGDPPVLLILPGLQMLEPRGRYDLVFSGSGLSLRSSNARAAASVAPATIAWADVLHGFRVPKPDAYRKAGAPARAYFLILVLRTPLQVGKQSHGCIVITADGAKPFASQPEIGKCEEVSGPMGQLHKQLAAALPAQSSAAADTLPEHEVLGRILAAALGSVSLEEPDTKCCPFEWFRAYRGTAEGALYPLPSGLLFAPRPSIFIEAEKIGDITTGREGKVHCGATNTDVGVSHLVGNETKTDVFSNLAKGDVPALMEYASTLLRCRARARPSSGSACATGEEEDEEEADEDYQTESSDDRPAKKRQAVGRGRAAAGRKRGRGSGAPLAQGPAKRTRAALAASGAKERPIDLDDLPSALVDYEAIYLSDASSEEAQAPASSSAA